MTLRTRSVAMLAANPAFAAILCRTLEDDGGHRVASFSGIEALTTYLRISPVDVIVLDTDMPGTPAIDIARGLRNHVRLASGAFEIIALTRAAETFHAPLKAAGIDVIVSKPVTPAQLLATIEQLAGSRRGQAPATHVPAARPLHQPVPMSAPQRPGNVVQLFGEGRSPR